MKCTNEDCVYSKDYMGTSGMRVLSWHNGIRKVDDKMVAHYERTVKWKCPNGHTSLETFGCSEPALPEPPAKERDDSVKRFHRKGFRGHKVNPPGTKFKNWLASQVGSPKVSK